MKNILVTGGAGYIGSHMLLALLDGGYKHITVLDDLSTGVRRAVPEGVDLVVGCVGDVDVVVDVLTSRQIDTVFHFAGSVSVTESVKNPDKYFKNNTDNTDKLVNACVAHGVRRLVFSSTAAVYGASDEAIAESGVVQPMTPYGESKLEAESFVKKSGLNYGILRYFNVFGADEKGRAGLWGTGESLMQFANDVAMGKREVLEIFGTDYGTKDGSAVRDFIHVSDLVAAHVLLAETMAATGENALLNVGYGTGASVKDVVAAYSEVLGYALPTRVAPRRAGDLAYVVADVSALEAALDWTPTFKGDLVGMVRSGVAWARR